MLDDFNVPGIEVYADNAFVSVGMLRWCKERGINLCGTTRRSYGFPPELTFEDMEVICLLFVACFLLPICIHTHIHAQQVGDSDWVMSQDGLLATAWLDVGETKGMYVVATHTYTHIHS